MSQIENLRWEWYYCDLRANESPHTVPNAESHSTPNAYLSFTQFLQSASKPALAYQDRCANFYNAFQCLCGIIIDLRFYFQNV